MLRVLLAAMIPAFAIGLAGVFITTIGRFLLAIPHDWTPAAGMVLTIAIMVGCGIADRRIVRRPRQP